MYIGLGNFLTSLECYPSILQQLDIMFAPWYMFHLFILQAMVFQGEIYVSSDNDY